MHPAIQKKPITTFQARRIVPNSDHDIKIENVMLSHLNDNENR